MTSQKLCCTAIQFFTTFPVSAAPAILRETLLPLLIIPIHKYSSHKYLLLTSCKSFNLLHIDLVWHRDVQKSLFTYHIKSNSILNVLDVYFYEIFELFLPKIELEISPFDGIRIS